MADLWTTELPWSPHQMGLARWAARRWRWQPSQGDWPSALALLAGAEDEGHTALVWAQAPGLWARRFSTLEPPPLFDLPHPELWPPALFEEGWLVKRGGGADLLVQTARNSGLEGYLFDQLVVRVAEEAPGEGQEIAVARAARTHLLLLTGGPGTGKTTTLKRLVDEWNRALPGLRCVVAAPTGRAAARARQSFAQATVVPECLTLHRLLGLRPGLGEPWHGRHRPLPFDLVIVDEASMLDLRTAVALVASLGDAALVLVGDPGQLPSVEAGSVLGGLLDHPQFFPARVNLTQRFRLDAASKALARVFDLVQGDPGADLEAVLDELRTLGDGRSADFRWVVTGEGEDPGPQALAAWGSPRNLTLADLDHRILLSPVHQGPGGTEALGALADRALGRVPGTISDGLPWMIQKNLPHLNLLNGDRGLVVRHEGRLWFTPVDDPGRRLPFSLVGEDGVQAWAVTVHKSQGSEFGAVVLVLPPQDSPGIVRELVYTGLTRARTSATLVCSEPALKRALARGTQRTTGFHLKGMPE